MKMVKTFMKTQHQQVMPPEERKKGVKENVQSKSTSLITGQSDGRARSPTQLQSILEDKVRRWQDSIRDKARRYPSLPGFSVVSLKIEWAFPCDSPAHPPTSPRGQERKDLTPQERLRSVLKILIDGSLSVKEPTPTPQPKKEKQSTMPVLFPLHIYTLDSKPCSHKVENRYDKTWLEKMTKVRT